MTPVPFLDLYRAHAPLEAEFVSALRDCVKRSAFTNGSEVSAFERAFANSVGTMHCIGMASGLDALVIAYRALGLKRGDRVVVPAMTFIATVEAVTLAGGVPLLVDVDDSGAMDLHQTEAAVTSGARFLSPVHLFGQLVDPLALSSLRERYKAVVVEDACQAHGAEKGGTRAGTIGDAAAFSFYPGKNLGALGDGGALCTSDANVDRISRALREHGQTKKYVHEFEGFTARLDNLQAAFLSAKLPHLKGWTDARIRAAAYYAERLSDIDGLTLQSRRHDGSHVYHLFVLFTKKRSELAARLQERQIGFGFHYPIPIHKCPCYAELSWAQGAFPNAERLAEEGISIPMFPGITPAEQDAVIDTIRSVHG